VGNLIGIQELVVLLACFNTISTETACFVAPALFLCCYVAFPNLSVLLMHGHFGLRGHTRGYIIIQIVDSTVLAKLTMIEDTHKA
jgi:hypothetical protein